MIRTKVPVLVVGAGPAGLLTALSLVRRGVEVEVIDTQNDLAGRSYALGLHAATLDLLHELDLGLDDLESAHRVDRVVLRTGDDEEHALELGGPRGPRPVTVLPQAALERSLLRRLAEESAPVWWSHRLAALDPATGAARVERIETAASGFTPGAVVTLVDRVFDVEAGFVVGADGHTSTVRRELDIPLDRYGGPHTYAIFEVLGDFGDESGVQLCLSADGCSALWPLGGGRWRWSLEVDAGRSFVEPRFKSRRRWEPAGVLPRDPREQLEILTEKRAPWFPADRTEQIVWSAVVTFEERLVERYGRDNAWLVGDAAHLWSPIGMQSLNLGLQEAHALAEAILWLLDTDDRAPLESYGAFWRDRWRRLSSNPERTSQVPETLQVHADGLPRLLPASGEDLEPLLNTVGLGLPD